MPGSADIYAAKRWLAFNAKLDREFGEEAPKVKKGLMAKLAKKHGRPVSEIPIVTIVHDVEALWAEFLTFQEAN